MHRRMPTGLQGSKVNAAADASEHEVVGAEPVGVEQDQPHVGGRRRRRGRSGRARRRRGLGAHLSGRLAGIGRGEGPHEAQRLVAAPVGVAVEVRGGRCGPRWPRARPCGRRTRRCGRRRRRQGRCRSARGRRRGPGRCRRRRWRRSAPPRPRRTSAPAPPARRLASLVADEQVVAGAAGGVLQHDAVRDGEAAVHAARRREEAAAARLVGERRGVEVDGAVPVGPAGADRVLAAGVPEAEVAGAEARCGRAGGSCRRRGASGWRRTSAAGRRCRRPSAPWRSRGRAGGSRTVPR